MTTDISGQVGVGRRKEKIMGSMLLDWKQRERGGRETERERETVRRGRGGRERGGLER